MSDYLSHLAARAIDAAATIRPRLASFYEPPAITNVTPELEASTETDATRARAMDANEPSRDSEPLVITRIVREVIPGVPSEQPAEPHGARSTELRPPVMLGTASPIGRAEATPSPQAPTTPPVRARVPEHLHESAAPLPNKTEPSRPIAIEGPIRRERAGRPVIERIVEDRPLWRVSAPQPAMERVIERIREIAAPPPDRQHIPSVAHVPSKDRVVTRPEPIAVAPRMIPQQPPQLPAAEPPRETIRVQSTPVTLKPTTRVVVEPRTVVRPQLAVPERMVHEEPSIHVTIGRVEVRAVPAAEPPARRSAPSPNHMSLDDYLRRRGERAKG